MLTRRVCLAALLVLGVLGFLAESTRGFTQPLSELGSSPLSLSPVNLPWYAARTTLRMLTGMGFVTAVHVHLRDVGGEEPAVSSTETNRALRKAHSMEVVGPPLK